MIRVLIADDSMLARAGLAALIGAHSDLTIVGQAVDGAQAVSMYEALSPDVLVVDLRMPGLDGVKVIEMVCAAHPDARALVMSHYDGDENVFRAMRAGAVGYLTKDAGGGELADAIRSVARGRRYIPQVVADQLAERALQRTLTPRELQVLAGVAEGKTNRVIAASLGLTEKTVTLYMTTIMAKLSVKSRTEAVAVAVKRGIVRIPGT